ncbi:polysaccharide deacetylase family protein [Xenorhabdus sp. Sc-CR9]|uniref:polysaccharide deacetylase family protein n=1 Tax=Xenorhabdus sp. Sc-CR9 TaxID=2584468 RepID=UPI001F29BC0B|nr:polysaccharide deacetylase family protein [Xenorhabdus sp. Sc-CR9]
MHILNSNILTWFGIIIRERFGIPIHVTCEKKTTKLHLENKQNYITIDEFQSDFYTPNLELSFNIWDGQNEGWKTILDNTLPTPTNKDLPTPLIEEKPYGYNINYDIVGLTYWMLNRLEEIGYTTLDKHQRFPATSSHAYKYGYLERPIVDEWLYILRQVIQKVWPELKLKEHAFNIKVSHDVDSPSLYAFKTWPSIYRIMAGHLIKRRDFKAFFTTPYIKLTSRKKLHPIDLHNTFDWIMDVSEENNLQSAFYFICGRTDKIKDADYEPEHPIIRDLMRRIHARGHEIGLHPSYGTYQKPYLINSEAKRLKRICDEEGIKQPVWGGRMHYLRWEHPTTLQAWNDAGMDYDTTLGYADHPGFRCGTCFEYPAFNPLTQQLLDIRIRPLIVMECTIIDSVYLGLGDGDESLDKFLELKNICSKVNGTFTLLWHNSHFKKGNLKSIYKRCLRY